jgi:Na+/phosphate symporter
MIELPESQRTKILGNTLANVQTALVDAVKALASEDRALARQVAARKPEIKTMAASEQAELGKRLQDGDISLEVFRIAADVVGQADRLFHDIRKMCEILADGSGHEKN